MNPILFLISLIYVYWAPPREGKTYNVTARALEKMEEFHKRRLKDPDFKGRVFANYPILHSKLGFCDVWEHGMEKWPIYDSFIVIDEAYRSFNSRKTKTFTDDEHLFFSTNGHNGDDIVLIAQHPNRIDLVIREMTDIFYLIRKVEIPLINRPLWFRLDGYLTMDDYKERHMHKDALYRTDRTRFSKRVGNAYDTHYFRKPADYEPEIINWADKLGVDPNNCKPKNSFLQNTIERIKKRFSSPELVTDEQ